MTASPLAVFHRSNTLTYLSLLSAIGAVAGAVHGSAGVAGALIAFSVIADTFDGQFARSFRRTSEQQEMGAQLDSLSDAIAFGAAPCVCMAALAQGSPGSIGVAWWLAFGAFSSCAIARLAFYNVTHKTTTGFIGLPVPVAALIWSSLLLIEPGIRVSTGVLAATAAAMVLPLRVPRPAGAGLAVFIAWPTLVIGAHLLRVS